MTTLREALALAKQEKELGNILDYYVDPQSGSVIAISDQGSYVWFDEDVHGEWIWGEQSC